MAKNSVSDWSTTASDNTDIGGIGIQGVNSPANLDDAMREFMAQLATWRTGGTFAGTVAATGTISITNTAPTLKFNDSNATTDEKIVEIVSADGDLTIRSRNDADSSGANVMVLARGTGTAWETASFALAGSTRLTISETQVTPSVPVRGAAGSASAPTFSRNTDDNTGVYFRAADHVSFTTGGTHRASIDSAGRLLVGDEAYDGTDISDIGASIQGAGASSPGAISVTTGATAAIFLNRQTDDGNLIEMYQGGTFEGAVSVSGTTITYGSFCGHHWSQLSDQSRPAILRGTIVETIDAMCEWTGEGNDQLAKFKISDTEASPAVYGVFMAWDEDDEENNDALIAALGAFVIRIKSGETVAKGDLIESAGNGCGQVQADSSVKASTVAKVTAAIPIQTYGDGSFLVPCVLYAG